MAAILTREILLKQTTLTAVNYLVWLTAVISLFVIAAYIRKSQNCLCIPITGLNDYLL